MSATKRFEQDFGRDGIDVLPARKDDRARSTQRLQPGMGHDLDATIRRERLARPVGAYDHLITVRSHTGETKDLDGDTKLERANAVIGQYGDEVANWL